MPKETGPQYGELANRGAFALPSDFSHTSPPGEQLQPDPSLPPERQAAILEMLALLPEGQIFIRAQRQMEVYSMALARFIAGETLSRSAATVAIFGNNQQPARNSFGSAIKGVNKRLANYGVELKNRHTVGRRKAEYEFIPADSGPLLIEKEPKVDEEISQEEWEPIAEAFLALLPSADILRAPSRSLYAFVRKKFLQRQDFDLEGEGELYDFVSTKFKALSLRTEINSLLREVGVGISAMNQKGRPSAKGRIPPAYRLAPKGLVSIGYTPDFATGIQKYTENRQRREPSDAQVEELELMHPEDQEEPQLSETFSFRLSREARRIDAQLNGNVFSVNGIHLRLSDHEQLILQAFGSGVLGQVPDVRLRTRFREQGFPGTPEDVTRLVEDLRNRLLGAFGVDVIERSNRKGSLEGWMLSNCTLSVFVSEE